MSVLWPSFSTCANRSGVMPHAVSILVTPPTQEPLTVDDAKLCAGLSWESGDPRDAMMADYIKVARRKVETDTELALLTQTREVYFDAIRGTILTLPAYSRPLQAVTWIKSTDAAGVVHTLDVANYHVDLPTARIGLSVGGAWPSDLRPFQPYVVRLVAGWPTVEALKDAEAPLVHLIGLLVAHYATVGRDVVNVGNIVTSVPFGYEDMIAPYRAVVVG